jgi:hypothetical protein
VSINCRFCGCRTIPFCGDNLWSFSTAQLSLASISFPQIQLHFAPDRVASIRSAQLGAASRRNAAAGLLGLPLEELRLPDAARRPVSFTAIPRYDAGARKKTARAAT